MIYLANLRCIINRNLTEGGRKGGRRWRKCKEEVERRQKEADVEEGKN